MSSLWTGGRNRLVQSDAPCSECDDQDIDWGGTDARRGPAEDRPDDSKHDLIP